MWLGYRGGMTDEPMGADTRVPRELLTHIAAPVSYTHLRAHETVLDLVCRLLLEKKKQPNTTPQYPTSIADLTHLDMTAHIQEHSSNQS